MTKTKLISLSIAYVAILSLATFVIGSFLARPRLFLRQTKYKSHFEKVAPMPNLAPANVDPIVELSAKVETKTERQIFKEYSQSLKQLVKIGSPQKALDQISIDFAGSQMIQNNCHALTHIIGNSALEKYENNVKTALSFGKETCGGGYVHGIIEHFLSQSSNPESEILTICEPKNEGCFHGIGHGIMILKKNDPFTSVQLCQKFSTDIQQIRCGEGIFMELFDSENSSDDEKPSLDVSDPTKICNPYTSYYRNACYYYASRYLFRTSKDPLRTLDKCLDYSEYDRSGCIKGASSAIVRSNLTNPSVMEEYCDVVTAYLNTCYQGAIDYHLFILGDKTKTKSDFCGKFEDPANQIICMDTIKASAFNQ
jgi:hypothetical protein